VIAYDSEDESLSEFANDPPNTVWHGRRHRNGPFHGAAPAWPLSYEAGRVVINGMTDDPQAPWGGFKIFGCSTRDMASTGIGAFFFEPKSHTGVPIHEQARLGISSTEAADRLAHTRACSRPTRTAPIARDAQKGQMALLLRKTRHFIIVLHEPQRSKSLRWICHSCNALFAAGFLQI